MNLLLSEHILCKESIVIVKRFDFEILTYLYVFRSPEFIYAIFGVMYVCMCVCVYVCVYMCVCVCMCVLARGANRGLQYVYTPSNPGHTLNPGRPGLEKLKICVLYC